MLVNPDSEMLKQSEGHWQRYMALVLHKLAGSNPVILTAEDIQDFSHSTHQYILVHGHCDSLEFRLITPEAAKVLADHDATQRGTA